MTALISLAWVSPLQGVYSAIISEEWISPGYYCHTWIHCKDGLPRTDTSGRHISMEPDVIFMRQKREIINCITTRQHYKLRLTWVEL